MIYFLRKNGYYYRHESAGYTESPVEAEIYDKEYALGHAKMHTDVQAVPVNEVSLNIEYIDNVLERLIAMKAFINIKE